MADLHTQRFYEDLSHHTQVWTLQLHPVWGFSGPGSGLDGDELIKPGEFLDLGRELQEDTWLLTGPAGRVCSLIL